MTKIAVIYYSATGNVHALAEAIAEGAAAAGAQVRLRRVAGLAPANAIDAHPTWRAHVDATANIPVATPDDVRWADGLAIGSPTRFGNISARLKQFLDVLGPLWAAGELTNKVTTGFTSADNLHGGNESTLLALYHAFYHWGAIVVAPGYTDRRSSLQEAIRMERRTPRRVVHRAVTCSPPPDIKGAGSPRSPRCSPVGNASRRAWRRPRRDWHQFSTGGGCAPTRCVRTATSTSRDLDRGRRSSAGREYSLGERIASRPVARIPRSR